MALPPIRRIGDTLIQSRHRASCHCGGVVLEGLRAIKGQDLLTLHRFNTMTAEHYFCSRCGIYTHHRRRSKPNQYGYNPGCLEGVDPNLVREVPVNDGVNHPADRTA